jgi:hypothetical protein
VIINFATSHCHVFTTLLINNFSKKYIFCISHAKVGIKSALQIALGCITASLGNEQLLLFTTVKYTGILLLPTLL